MVWADEPLVHPAVRLPVHQADQVGVHHRQQEAAPVQLQQLLIQAAQQPRLLLPGQLLLAARVRVRLPVEVGLPVLGLHCGAWGADAMPTQEDERPPS